MYAVTLFQMQSVQPHLWSDVAYQAVNSLGPAAITAIVSWLAFRSQRRIKESGNGGPDQVEGKRTNVQFVSGPDGTSRKGSD